MEPRSETPSTPVMEASTEVNEVTLTRIDKLHTELEALGEWIAADTLAAEAETDPAEKAVLLQGVEHFKSRKENVQAEIDLLQSRNAADQLESAQA